MDKRINKANFTAEENEVWNRKTIELFKYFIQICNQHNIKYFCGFGTALGAIRHKGMIPWDDDIDVCIPRKEYERFVKICSGLKSDKYEIVVPEKNMSCITTHARLMDKNSTILFWRRIPDILGIYIDIFPIDGIPTDKNLAQSHFCRYLHYAFCYRESHCRYSMENIYYYLTHKQKLRPLTAFLFSSNRVFFHKFFLNKIKKIFLTYSYEDSEMVITYSTIYGLKMIVPKKWIEETVCMEFEGMEVLVPKFYHEYLSHFYGEYMQPPPIAQRYERHMIDYYNLYQRESLPEILQHIKEQNR